MVFSALQLIFYCFLPITAGPSIRVGAEAGKGVSIDADTLSNPLLIHRCNDFITDGQGANVQWEKAAWMPLTKLDSGGENYQSRCKMLYSNSGIYVLFSGDDDKITTKEYNDFEAIFNGDVFEVFFYPPSKDTVYFEYEINALNRELIFAISRRMGQQYSWAPRYPSAEARKPIKKSVLVKGGIAAVGSSITGWSAELFFPFPMLALLANVPPISGTVWKANFCRLDYDSGQMIKYSWTAAIEKSFHELDKFRSIRFE